MPRSPRSSALTMSYDYIVVGLGGHGSAAAAHLAKRGFRVLGLEKFARESHSHGSSHGRSRIIRSAYYEAPQYVPLLKRSFELWRELQASATATGNGDGEPLLTMTGGLMIGLPDSVVVQGTLASAREHNLPHRVLSAAEISQRFPGFSLRSDEVGVLEDEAGFLVPELCVQAHCAQAEQHGAVLQYDEPLLSWAEDDSAGGGGVVVHTAKGSYTARKMVLAVGAWAPELYGKDIALPLQAARRVLYWLQPRVPTVAFDGAPVYIWDLGPEGNFYGFPRQDGPPGGVKVAMHCVSDVTEDACTPESIDRVVSPGEEAAMRAVLTGRMPLLADGSLTATATCMYTNTPDEHFLIDWHPRCDKVLLASPCSGHGFKFCAVVGEIVAELLIHGATRHDTKLFRLDARQSDAEGLDGSG